MDNWTILFLVLIVIGSIGGISFSIKQLYNAKENQTEIIKNLSLNAEELREANHNLKKQMEALEKSNDTLTINLQNRDKKLALQNEKIEDLNSKIFKKSEFIQNTLFGEGFCYLGLEAEILPKVSIDDAILYLAAINDFDFPLYNLNIEVFDFDLLEGKAVLADGIQKIDVNSYSEALIFKKNYSEINPSYSITIAGHPIDYLRIRRYYIKIHHRNGTYWERILLYTENKNKNIYSLIEVFDQKNGDLVHSEYSFPEGKKESLLKELNKIDVGNIKFLQH